MRVSKRKVNKALERELFQTLFQVVVDIKNTKEAEQFLLDFLGKDQLITTVKRLAVAYWLEKGRGVTNIRENLAVSSATIETIKRQLNSPGIKLAIKKIEAEVWANKWTEKIKNFIK